ncbi:MAG: carbon-nitrogen hydrolase family protein [Labrys sp. (in: a-proteobacteria)]|jgi:predicted amidohydrolase
MATVRIAAAQYPIDWFDGFQAFEAKLARWVDEAADEGAQLLVFPEYAAMETVSLHGRDVTMSIPRSFEVMAELLPRIDALHAELAARRKVHILAGSAVLTRDGGLPNVARLITPKGSIGVQDKRTMTKGERRDFHVTRGGPIRVFDTSLGLIGVSICYDIEFPLIARAQVKAGAKIILAPSYTETMAGYSRVRIGAMARALENQCVTVQSPLVGTVDWSVTVDIASGRAGIYGPPDIGFPDDGVIAQGEMNRPQWVYGTADYAAIDEVRRDGRVLNHAHWDEQDGAEVPVAEVVSLA